MNARFGPFARWIVERKGAGLVPRHRANRAQQSRCGAANVLSNKNIERDKKGSVYGHLSLNDGHSGNLSAQNGDVLPDSSGGTGVRLAVFRQDLLAQLGPSLPFRS